MPAGYPVDLWTIDLTAPRSSPLSEEEENRAARFRFDTDRIRWMRARSALRQVLAGYTGDPPERMAFTLGPHGKPALFPASELQFNLSHAGDFAMIAVCRVHPVGVDIERIRPEIDIAALLRRLGESDLPQSTAELYQRWTAREACSKAAGGALFTTPPANIGCSAVSAPAGYAASLALFGVTDIMVIHRG